MPRPESRAAGGEPLRASRKPEFRLDQRSSGILLHMTSLPGPHGSGDMGREAFQFVDFLSAAGMRWWQMLPTTPIGPGNSPYASSSGFAGNPLLIDLRELARQGWLTRVEAGPLPGASDRRVKFASVIPSRLRALASAYRRWRDGGGACDREFVRFCRRNAHWLEDYALYHAIKTGQRGRAWHRWPAALRDRQPRALHDEAQRLDDQIQLHRFVQFIYQRQWDALRNYAHSRGVGFIGDLPIFNAHDSADVWAQPALYEIDRNGRPTALTGCPPDAFSDDGQFWGHPQYDWAAHQRSGFAWWIERLRRLMDQFDAVRIDHFLGFHRVWWIPAHARTAREGRYVPSPGDALFSAVTKALGKVNIIAEDLGATTPEAFALRDKYGFPGMRTLIMGFGSDDPGSQYHLPHQYPRDCAAYTGTHDNETWMGWLQRIRSAAARNAGNEVTEIARVERYFGRMRDSQDRWKVLRSLFMSVANLTIVPIQDVLGLGAAHRMNIPATATGNWAWRLEPRLLNWGIAETLREMQIAYGRIVGTD